MASSTTTPTKKLFKIFYMNQGGAGNNSTTPTYANYDLLLIAENSSDVKRGFSEQYAKGRPLMSIQLSNEWNSSNSSTRVFTDPTDLDKGGATVRPIVTFQLNKVQPPTPNGPKIGVVFLHLKSGNEQEATDALSTAAKNVLGFFGKQSDTPLLWIGDFNRAKIEGLTDVFKNVKVETLLQGGGQALWNLDRAIITGNWGGWTMTATKDGTSGDNGHIGIWVSLPLIGQG